MVAGLQSIQTGDKLEMDLDFNLLVEGILAVWTIVLLWGSWQLSCVAHSLVEERRELRRWKRLSAVRDKQQREWN